MKSLIKTIVMLALLSTAIHANQVDGQTKATKTDSYLNWETLKRPINLFYAASGFVAAKIANWWVRPPAQVMAPSDQTSKGNRVSSLNNLREQALKKLEASLKKPTIASLPGGENKVSDVVAAVASSVGSAAAASIAPAPKSLATRIDDQVKVLNRARAENSDDDVQAAIRDLDTLVPSQLDSAARSSVARAIAALGTVNKSKTLSGDTKSQARTLSLSLGRL